MTEADTGADYVPASVPKNRMVVAVLSLAGIFLSVYLVAHNLGLAGPIQCGVGDCGAVQASTYAWVGPIPVSGIGLAGYAALLIISILGLQPGRMASTSIALLLVGGAGGGVLFSAYLTYLEAAVIHAWCQYCVISAIIISLIFLATLPEIGRVRRRSDSS